MFSKEELEAMARSVSFWWHSIDLGYGVITKGAQSANNLADKLQTLHLPDLYGKTVLDIGAYDGFYSFEAERRGARRVLALDHYVWSLDLPEHIKYWNECREKGIIPEQYHKTPHWHPVELPGKRGFDTAHQALGSKVEALVADFMKIDLGTLWAFDVVFFLGVLYHMENPLEAIKRVSAVTREVAIVETEAIYIPGYEHIAFCEFFESNELNADVSNWWAPNEKALVGLCRAAGFGRVETIIRPPRQSLSSRLKPAINYLLSEFPIKQLRRSRPNVVRYRAVVHAWK